MVAIFVIDRDQERFCVSAGARIEDMTQFYRSSNAIVCVEFTGIFDLDHLRTHFKRKTSLAAKHTASMDCLDALVNLGKVLGDLDLDNTAFCKGYRHSKIKN